MSEAEEHNDLVVEDFQESYLNLTVKTTFLLKWLNSSHCSRARFILKVDDDVYVNPTNLWATLEQTPELRSGNINYVLTGHVWEGSLADRNPDSRYSQVLTQMQGINIVHCPGITCHHSCFLTRSCQPSSVVQPSSSRVLSCPLSTPVL